MSNVVEIGLHVRERDPIPGGQSMNYLKCGVGEMLELLGAGGGRGVGIPRLLTVVS